MASPRLGATNLGLAVRWQYSFVPQGTTLTPMRGCVCLDVGNKAVEGILDTHAGDTGAESTAQLVLTRPELFYEHLLGAYLDRAEAGERLDGNEVTLTLLTHVGPDFDSVVATLLVHAMVETGSFPLWARALVEYACEVDQGRYKAATALLRRPKTAEPPAAESDREEALTSPVHAAYLAVQCLPDLSNEARLRRGLALVRATAEAVAAGPNKAREGWNFHAFQPSAAFWRTELEEVVPQDGGNRKLKHSDLLAALAPELALWTASRATAEALLVELPAKEGGTVKVPALILAGPTPSKLHKYWCRAEGLPYFVCPSDPDDIRVPGVHGKVILSLDPDFRVDGKTPTLRGLGYALEQAELKARGVADPRVKIPRFDDGSCNNADPWYDGRSFDFTIVDAPNSRTMLPYDEVKRIAKARFWEPPLGDAVITVVRHGSAAGAPPLPGMTVSLKPVVAGCEVVVLCGTTVTLDDLEPWLEGVLKGGETRVRIDGVHSHPFWPLDSVVNRLSAKFGASEPLGDEEVHFASGLVWAVRRVLDDRVQAQRRPSSFVDVAAVDLCLNAFRKTTKDAVDANPGLGAFVRGTARSSKTRHDFLKFRVGALDAASGADAASAALYEHLHIAERADRIKSDLDELAGIEAATSEKVLEALMASVSVAGVAQTVAALFAMTEVERSPLFWACLAGSTMVPVVIAGVLISRRSGNG